MKVPIASCQLPIAVGALGLTLASSGCSSPPLEKTDARLSNLASAGRLAFEQGSLTAAARYYTAALERARVMDNAGEIANAAYNLAACMIETGQYTAALRLLEEAGMESRRAGRDAADIRLLTARTERLTGNSGAATIIAE
jgi:thioredoxin-like negative regulator of GroEL